MYVTKHESMSVRLVPFIRCLAAGAARCICAAAGSARAAVYNIYSDFSSSSDPSGAWTYGYEPSVNGAFTTYATEQQYGSTQYWFYHTVGAGGLPNIGHGGLVGYPTGSVEMQAGDNSPSNSNDYAYVSVLRFTAPSAGAYSADINFTGIGAGSDTQDYVYVDGAPVLQQEVKNQGTATYSNGLLTLTAGEIVDIIVSNGAGNSTNPGDTNLVGVTAVLQSPPADVPEPASLALLGVAVVWMTAVRRRIRQAI
jgi:hypothetical protein